MTDYEKEQVKGQLINYLDRITRTKAGKYICPLCSSGTGEHGTPAFNIIPGKNNQQFKCHSCGAGGDIFDLYQLYNKVNQKTAFKELGEMYLNNNNYKPTTQPQKQPVKEQSKYYTRFFYIGKQHLHDTDYLTKRGISREIQEKFNCGYIQKFKYGENQSTSAIIIPTSTSSFMWRSTIDNTKQKRGKAHIFNISDLEKKFCFIAEGEIDALSIIQCGFPCIGLGSVNMVNELLAYCKNKRPAGVLIFALDNDKAGKKAMEIIPEFQKVGIRCMTFNVSGTAKDPNDLLVADSEQLKRNLQQAIEQAKNIPVYAPVSADERALQELQFDETGKLTIHNLETYLKLMNISVKYNDITHKLSISGVDQKESNDHINENIIPLIYDTMQHEFKKCNVNMIKQFLEVIATRNRFNPVIDMLNGVKWDGIDRLEQVYNMFQIDQEDELSRILLKKWFMQCICGLHNTDSDSPFSLDIVLIFQGQQGAGKTRFFEHIAMNKKLFGEGVIIDPRNKDTHIQATSRWICELGEIGTTMRKDVDSLKAFLTLSSDTYRKPYGHTDLEYNRMTSFCGTTNDEKFLIDETGNRRFATIPLKSDLYIDYDAQVKTFDSLQFWSQIAELVETEIKKNNKSYASVFRLTREELIQLNERNREFEKPLKGEEEVTDVLCSLEMMKQDKTKNVVIEYMTVTEFISQHTELKGLNSRQVGKVLDKLGYPMIKKKINGTVQRVRELPRFKGIANYPEYN